jgi:hypothetical protein
MRSWIWIGMRMRYRMGWRSRERMSEKSITDGGMNGIIGNG